MRLNLVMEILVYSWKKIGCKPYKTQPYHPKSNGLAERMVQTVKKWDWKHVLSKKKKKKKKKKSISIKPAFKLSHDTTRR